MLCTHHVYCSSFIKSCPPFEYDHDPAGYGHWRIKLRIHHLRKLVNSWTLSGIFIAYIPSTVLRCLGGMILATNKKATCAQLTINFFFPAKPYFKVGGCRMRARTCTGLLLCESMPGKMRTLQVLKPVTSKCMPNCRT